MSMMDSTTALSAVGDSWSSRAQPARQTRSDCGMRKTELATASTGLQESVDLGQQQRVLALDCCHQAGQFSLIVVAQDVEPLLSHLLQLDSVVAIGQFASQQGEAASHRAVSQWPVNASYPAKPAPPV